MPRRPGPEHHPPVSEEEDAPERSGVGVRAGIALPAAAADGNGGGPIEPKENGALRPPGGRPARYSAAVVAGTAASGTSRIGPPRQPWGCSRPAVPPSGGSARQISPA